ncbi:MAG: enoyl-CoA hydratase-related protein [Myxococcota bacterium]|nr:enoyl-CoA hydratase-related protein [Myxococcota bacterium]
MSSANGHFKKIAVRTDHGGQILVIRLSSPPGNVLEGQMMAEIRDCVDAAATEPDLKAIVFEGEGKHFCFGASVEEHKKERAPAMISGFNQLFKSLLATERPLIAVVRGQCLGGGMELAAFCSFIIAEPSAKFGQPEIHLGVLPPVAAAILPDIIGQSRADDLILTGRSIDAETALDWGLVHSVAENGSAARDAFIATHILPKSAAALRHAYRASRAKWFADLNKTLDDMAQLYVQELMETADANEGITAFLEKRSPNWKNC